MKPFNVGDSFLPQTDADSGNAYPSVGHSMSKELPANRTRRRHVTVRVTSVPNWGRNRGRIFTGC